MHMNFIDNITKSPLYIYKKYSTSSFIKQKSSPLIAHKLSTQRHSPVSYCISLSFRDSLTFESDPKLHNFYFLPSPFSIDRILNHGFVT